MKLFKAASKNCPCESGKTYGTCCKLYHIGLPNHVFAPSAEALMRARYSAFVLALEDYLLKTWHPETRPMQLDLANDENMIKWLGLQVKQHQVLTKSTATVEFIAHYKMANNTDVKALRHHEISQFIKINLQWFYLDGKTMN